MGSRPAETDSHLDGVKSGVGPVADVRGVTELLYEHTWDYDEGHCECGWSYIDADGNFTYDWSEHVARILKETFDIKPRVYG